MIALYGDRVPESEKLASNLSILFQAIFSQQQEGFRVFDSPKLVSFHEVGSYMGWFCMLLLVLFWIYKRKEKKDLVLFVLAVLFLWIASGIGGWFNPIVLIKQLPLVKNIHIPMRFIFLVWVILLFYLSLSITWLQERLNRIIFSVLVLVLVLNFRGVYAFAYKRVMGYAKSTISSEALNFSLSSSRIDQTKYYPFSDYYPTVKNSGYEFLGYKAKNTAYQDTYDPAKPDRCVLLGQTASFFHGEVNGNQKNLCQVKLLEYIPGKIRLKIRTKKKSRILLNTGYLAGWHTFSKQVNVINNRGLLALDVYDFHGEITLYYGGQQKRFLFLSYFIGLGLFVYFSFTTRWHVRLR